jgi:hypothetical protein
MIDPWAPISISRAEAGVAPGVADGMAPPECDFEASAATRKAAPGTVDPDLLEIARLEMERDCYKEAEQSLRHRLETVEPSTTGMK